MTGERMPIDEPDASEAPPTLWRVLAGPVSLALAAIALIVGVMIGVGLDEEEAAAPPPPTTLPAGYEEGEALFASQGCGGCHALEVAGSNGATGPSLDVTQLTEPELAAVIANGRGAMPAFSPGLSDEEIDAVAVYVATAASGSP